MTDVKKRAATYQYVVRLPLESPNDIPKTKTVKVCDMSKEELMVALMDTMDVIDKIAKPLILADRYLENWQRGRDPQDAIMSFEDLVKETE